jgi:radical SAM superfamily enzyme
MDEEVTKPNREGDTAGEPIAWSSSTTTSAVAPCWIKYSCSEQMDVDHQKFVNKLEKKSWWHILQNYSKELAIMQNLKNSFQTAYDRV